MTIGRRCCVGFGAQRPAPLDGSCRSDHGPDRHGPRPAVAGARSARALLATEPSGAALQQVVDEALTLNITRDEIVAALVCLLPTVGLRQAAMVGPRLGLAIGYDVEAALALG